MILVTCALFLVSPSFALSFLPLFVFLTKCNVSFFKKTAARWIAEVTEGRVVSWLVLIESGCVWRSVLSHPLY
jgi:hypothetical protein